jgi:hypothetical protein
MTTGTPVVVSRIQNRRGTLAQFQALYPPGSYLGTYPTEQPGTGTNILQPGEIALITDAPGRVFIGTADNYYLELSTATSTVSLNLKPLQLVLQPTFPVGAWWPLPPLNTTGPTPFYSILYSITDAVLPGPSDPALANTVGTRFSKNGELQITAISLLLGYVSLTDTGTDINAYASPYDINFRADYDGAGNIQISYMHDFPVPLTFSTSSITWTSF